MKSITLLVGLLICSSAVMSQDGTLDPSFGNSGSTILPYFEEEAQILTIIKIGNALYAGGYTKENKQDFSIIKLDLNGALDANFGENGLLRFDLNSGFGRCSKMLIHPDGGIMVMGWDRNGNKDEYVLLKMDLNGNLDTNFGTNGVSGGSWSSSSFAESEIADAVFLSDGRLITAGRSYNGQNTDFVVACYDVSGNPCSDFGTNGKVTEEFDTENLWEIASEITRDADDNIYVGGNIDNNSVDAYAVVKYNKSGSRVNSFGDSGILDFGNENSETRGLGDISIDKSGRLIISGSINSGTTYGYVVRYDLNGNLDASFGDGGEVILTGLSGVFVKDAKIIDNNTILVAGNTSGFGSKQVIAKIDNTGKPVSNFGNNGITSVFLESTFNGISAIAFDSECIYAGGYTHNGDHFKFAVSKFTNLLLANSDINNDLSTINLFPNPTSSVLNIESEKGFYTIRVFNNTGKSVYNSTSKNLEFSRQIPVVEWSNGLYHVTIEGSSATRSMKFYKE